MKPPPYDGSLQSRLAHSGYLLGLQVAALRSTLALGPRPTAAQLEKHARKFGPAHVAETAAEVGVDVDVSDIPEPRRPRRRKR